MKLCMTTVRWKIRASWTGAAAFLSAALMVLAGCAQRPPSGIPVTVSASTSSPGLGATGNREAAVATTATGTANAGPRLMRGLYAFKGDSGVFTDCTSGRPLRVASEADHMTLERAYSISRSFGESLLTSVEASVAMRPGAAAQLPSGAAPDVALRPTLVVQRFVGLSSDTSCPSLRPALALEATYWKLEKLAGRQINAPTRRAEPHLILQSARKRVSGSSGCNRLTGTYALEGNRLTFIRTAATGKTCREGVTQERALIATLGKVKTWQIANRQLMLADAQGATVAQFSPQSAR